MSDHPFAAYAFEKVSKAFHVLVLGEGELRHRLSGAWAAGLFIVLPEMVPTDLRHHVETLRAFFLRGSGKPELREIEVQYGIANASVARLGPKKLLAAANTLWDLYDQLGAKVR